MLPDFFIVGAPKAGTTSLYHYLGQHPDIYLSPIKEPAYFAPDLAELKRLLGTKEADPKALRDYLNGPMTPGFSGVVTDWDQYLRLFRNAQHGQAVGEASGNYLASHAAPAAIRNRVPGARIIMILRDPVERLYSQHAEAVARGDVRQGFLPWVHKHQALEASSRPRLGAVWNGFYAQHLRRYLQNFAAEQVRSFFYEDLCASPLQLVLEVCDFLGISRGHPIDVSRRHNVTLQPMPILVSNTATHASEALRRVLPHSARLFVRQLLSRRPVPLTHSERGEVLKIYKADICELQGLTGRDLSAWLTA